MWWWRCCTWQHCMGACLPRRVCCCTGSRCCCVCCRCTRLRASHALPRWRLATCGGGSGAVRICSTWPLVCVASQECVARAHTQQQQQQSSVMLRLFVSVAGWLMRLADGAGRPPSDTLAPTCRGMLRRWQCTHTVCSHARNHAAFLPPHTLGASGRRTRWLACCAAPVRLFLLLCVVVGALTGTAWWARHDCYLLTAALRVAQSHNCSFGRHSRL